MHPVPRYTQMRIRKSALAACLLFFLFALSPPLLTGAPIADSGLTLYRDGIYDLAALHYMRKIGEKKETPFTRQMLSLSLMRLGKFDESRRWLEGNDFTSSYLRMFAVMKSSEPMAGFKEWESILKNEKISDEQRDRVSLLAGALYLEAGDYAKSRAHFERLVRFSRSDTVRGTGQDIVASLDRYQELPRKSPALAAILSAILPGAGQVYAEQTVDGITLFFYNAIFIGSAAYANHLETVARRPHTGSALLGTVGALFYLSGITGAASSANRFNIYQERLFQQEIRDRYLNLDAVERSSGIAIRASY
jgi:tetratricopeptide (TPR) repeat protein